MTERCSRCGSNRFVAISLDEGLTRRAQCIPCGYIEAPALPDDWCSPHRKRPPHPGRAEMDAARKAGKAKHHEQRLDRAHYNEAVKAAAVAIGRAFNGDPLTWRAEAEAAVDAAVPHLRAYQIEIQARIGFQLGRKQAAEEIASVIEAYHGDPCPDGCEDCELIRDLARLAREIGTKGTP